MQYTMDDGVCYDLTIETQAIIDKRAYITNLGVFLQVYFVLRSTCQAASVQPQARAYLDVAPAGAPVHGTSRRRENGKMEKGTELSGGAFERS